MMKTRRPATRLPAALRPTARPTITIGGAAGGYATGMAALGTTTSLFLADGVGVGPGLVGLYFTVCAVAAVVINPGLGWFSDRLADRRALLAVTATSGAAAALVFSAVPTYGVVLATGAVLLSLNDAYIAQLFAYVKEFTTATGRDLTRSSSAVRAVFSAGWVIGPPAGLLLVTRLGFAPLYLAVAAVLLLTGLLSGRRFPVVPAPARGAVRTGPRSPVDGEAVRCSRGPFRVLTAVPRRTLLVLGAVTAVNVADQMYLIDVALYVTRSLHHSAVVVGGMAAVCAALELPLIVVVGRVADRFGTLRLTIVATVVAVGFFCLVATADTSVTLLVLQVPNAVWTAVFATVPMVMVQQETPGGAGTVSSLYSITFPVAQLSAGGAVGIVAGYGDHRDVFWVCAALCLVALAFLLCRAALRTPAAAAVSGRAASPWRP